MAKNSKQLSRQDNLAKSSSLSLSLSLSSRLKNFVKGQGGFTIVELLIVVVVIAILAAITVVAYNGITQQAKKATMASELSQWKKASELHKIKNNVECPEGYSFIYGNATLGTSDFCVMKYEAKNDGGKAVSTASGAPWVSITQTDAISAATATGGHLITEAEWMTIAADVLSVKYNWSGNAVGSGYIYQGHVANNPASALTASADDADTMNGITGGTGDTVGANSSRVLYLSSGDVIWDLSGNVYEWTQQAVGAPTLTASQIGVSSDTGFNWREWTPGAFNLGNLAIVSRSVTLVSYKNPTTGVILAGVTGWDANKGVGRVYANYADAGARAFVRGGTWYNGPGGGVLTLLLNTAPSGMAAYIGFRVAR